VQQERIHFKVRGEVIRNKNGNGLDCRKENLLCCTASDRSHGQAMHLDKRTSKYKGVYYDKQSGRFHAQIMIDGKRKNLGRFASQKEAAEAYDRVAREHFGAFARPNLPRKRTEC
jgi:hypothetical protein